MKNTDKETPEYSQKQMDQLACLYVCIYAVSVLFAFAAGYTLAHLDFDAIINFLK